MNFNSLCLKARREREGETKTPNSTTFKDFLLSLLIKVPTLTPILDPPVRNVCFDWLFCKRLLAAPSKNGGGGWEGAPVLSISSL